MAKTRPAQIPEVADVGTSQVAAELQIGPARVRQLLAELKIQYEIKAGRIFLTRSQVEQLKQRNTRRGRIPNHNHKAA